MTQQPWGRPPGQPPVQQPSWTPAPAPWGPTGYPEPPIGPPPRPPRGGGRLGLVLLSVAAALAVGFFAWSLVSYLNRGADVPPQSLPTESTQPPQASPTSPPPSPTVPPTPSPYESPTPAPTPSATDATPTTSPSAQPSKEPPPPDLPVPKSWDEVDEWLLKNPLYGESLKVPTNCALGRIDITTASVKELEAHIDTLLDCTMKVWTAPMERAGWVLPRPPVTVYSQPVTTACGTLPTHNAYYCSADQRLYYATDMPEVFAYFAPGVLNNAFILDSVMAHEFGHAVQGRSGIWVSYAISRQRATDEAQSLEYSRRVEVQADCFAGAFLNAVAKATKLTRTEREGLLQVSAVMGDDTLGQPGKPGDHGQGATRRHWMEAGLKSKKLSACNTWTAPAKHVR